MNRNRHNLHPRLTYRIVKTPEGWGKGQLLSDAKDDYRNRTGQKCPRDCDVWAVANETSVKENGDLTWPQYTPAPVYLSGG